MKRNLLIALTAAAALLPSVARAESKPQPLPPVVIVADVKPCLIC